MKERFIKLLLLMLICHLTYQSNATVKISKKDSAAAHIKWGGQTLAPKESKALKTQYASVNDKTSLYREPVKAGSSTQEFMFVEVSDDWLDDENKTQFNVCNSVLLTRTGVTAEYNGETYEKIHIEGLCQGYASVDGYMAEAKIVIPQQTCYRYYDYGDMFIDVALIVNNALEYKEGDIVLVNNNGVWQLKEENAYGLVIRMTGEYEGYVWNYSPYCDIVEANGVETGHYSKGTWTAYENPIYVWQSEEGDEIHIYNFYGAVSGAHIVMYPDTDNQENPNSVLIPTMQTIAATSKNRIDQDTYGYDYHLLGMDVTDDNRLRLNEDIEYINAEFVDEKTISYVKDGYSAIFTNLDDDGIGYYMGYQTGVCFTLNDGTFKKYAKPSVETPTFSQTDDKLTISCATSAATIYYTIGGEEPTNASTKYTDPITITDNRVVKAIAYAESFNPSAVASYTPNSATCQQVLISVNGTTATLTCATSEATIYYTLDGTTPTRESNKYDDDNKITLTHNCTIKAIAVKEYMNDSPMASYEVNTFIAAIPAFSQTADKLTISCETANSTIYYAVGGEEPTNASTKYTLPITITDNRVVKAIAYAENFNPSEMNSYTPTNFTCKPVTIGYDGCYVTLTTATDGATIHYTTDGNAPTKSSAVYTKPFDAEGMVTVKAFAVKDYHNDSECTAEAFGYYNNGIVAWINDAAATEKAFGHYGNDSIAAIVWNVSSTFPKDLISGIDNPNLLFYTKSAAYAPSSIKNVVVNGTAERITLQDTEGNSNFFVPEPFRARTISYTHNYSLPTIIGENAGWETIALPFDVQKYVHQTNGEIVPFAKYQAGDKPFWLYSLEQSGFAEADGIKANTPYIISMPNNDDYADEYILGGNVTFSAENCDVSATKAVVKEYRNRMFVPTMLKVKVSDRVMAINKEIYDNHYPGSLFVHNLRDVKPFEAYVTASDAANLPRAISIAELCDVADGIARLPMADKKPTGLRIYNLNGVCVKTVKDGANITEGLAKGVYIVNNRKIVVR